MSINRSRSAIGAHDRSAHDRCPFVDVSLCCNMYAYDRSPRGHSRLTLSVPVCEGRWDHGGLGGVAPVAQGE